jgi:hypothetical protein
MKTTRPAFSLGGIAKAGRKEIVCERALRGCFKRELLEVEVEVLRTSYRARASGHVRAWLQPGDRVLATD